MSNFVFVLKEVNFLDSGEKEFYIDVYSTVEKCQEDLEDQLIERQNEYGAIIEWRDGNEVKLSDPEGNIYLFSIEMKEVK
jgi:hypothetical protein